MPRLEAAKLEAQAGRLGLLSMPDGRPMVVAPGGWKHGGVYCTWSIERDGIRYDIVNRAELIKNRFNVFVHLGSAVLMQYGRRGACEEVGRVLDVLGFEVDIVIPSRIDLRLDLVGVPVSELVVPFEKEHRICRARKSAVYKDGYAYTGFSIGSGDVVLRVYDKRREAEQESCGVKLSLLKRLWGGIWPDHVARVEFQLRRNAMRDRFGVSDLPDLREKLGHVVEWLTQEWFRLMSGPVDRNNKNHQRVEVAPIWKRVCEGFVREFGQVVEMGMEWERTVPEVRRLMQAGLGSLTSAMATLGMVPCNLVEGEAAMRRLLRMNSEVAEQAFRATAAKRRELEARFPAESLGDCGPISGRYQEGRA